MATFNLDATDLSSVDFQGLINEDVMQAIWDISRIPLPLTDMIGSDSSSNPYTEWTTDQLQDVDLDNAVVDGADVDQNDTNLGDRIGNQHQESIKEVRVSTRARSSDSIGRADELSYQVMMRQQELRRDVEAISLSNQASVADDGNATAGRSGGLAAWLSGQTQSDIPGDATGGAFAAGIVSAYVPGTKRALTEDTVKDVVEAIYIKGGDPRVIMGIPAQIRKFNEYLFTSSARIATLEGETSADGGRGQLTAKGSVNVWIADHGQILELHPNRLQPVHDSLAGTAGDASNLFVLDPAYLAHGYLTGYRVEPLSKTGLSDKRLMHVDWTLKPYSLDAHGVITDLDFTAPVTAS